MLLLTSNDDNVDKDERAQGSVPFRPIEFSTIICTPPNASVELPTHLCQLPDQAPSKQ